MERRLKFLNQKVFLKVKNSLFFDIPNYLPKDVKKVIITDSKIPLIYVNYLKEKLEAKVFVFKSGEKQKNYKTVNKIIDFLQDNYINKNDLLIALGGGVCIDIVGFVASIYKRGIEYVSIPTSSLAMIDSCVGGKTGIDFNNVKNIIGSIYHPKYIFVDPKLLKTLPKRHLNNGLVEALKMGLSLDKDLYDLFLESNLNLNKIIKLSIKNKIKVVLNDEKDIGNRQILNFGHSFGHCIEAYTSFKLLHGEAVGNGMILELKNQDIRKKVITILNKLNIPLIDVNIDLLNQYLKNDKKINNQHITLCNIKEIGKAQLIKIDINQIRKWLDV